MYDLKGQQEMEVGLSSQVKREVIQGVILFLFFLPVFFQLSGVIFDSHEMKFDSQGKLMQLPIPLAAITCFIGIAILLRLEKNHFGVGFIFSIFMAMFFAAIISGENGGLEELAKFILLIQFILPMFGLVLGMLYVRPNNEYLRFEAIALYVLLFIIPAEVIVTLLSDNALLSPSMCFFSLYQHLQYLPVIFVGFYFLSVSSLFETKHLRHLIIFLAPFVGVYIAASLSALTILLAGIVSLATIFLLVAKGRKGFCFLVIVFLWGGFLAHYPAMQSNPTYNLKYGDERAEKLLKKVEGLKIIDSESEGSSFRHKLVSLLPGNIQERLYYWEFYGRGVLDSPKEFIFGHAKRPDRTSYPSAHNYYLDLVYHFGVISLLPFCYLIFQTIKKCGKVIFSNLTCPNFMMLILMVGFYVFIDSLLKVSFRQPYSGMMMFFLWGVLLGRVAELKVKEKLFADR